MAEQGSQQGGEQGGESRQQNLPGVGSDDAVRAAEARAKAAEARAKEIEEREAQRKAEAEKAAKDSQIKTVDDAKRARDEAEARAKAAEKRARELEDRERSRIEERFATLPDDAKERVSKYRDKLDLYDFESMVNDELQRSSGSSEASGANPPPPGTGRMRGSGRNMDGDRNLQPKSLEILDELMIDPRAAQKKIKVEFGEGGAHKFLFPQKDLIRWTKERAHKPMTLDAETAEKMLNL